MLCAVCVTRAFGSCCSCTRACSCSARVTASAMMQGAGLHTCAAACCLSSTCCTSARFTTNLMSPPSPPPAAPSNHVAQHRRVLAPRLPAPAPRAGLHAHSRQACRRAPHERGWHCTCSRALQALLHLCGGELLYATLQLQQPQHLALCLCASSAVLHMLLLLHLHPRLYLLYVALAPLQRGSKHCSVTA